MSGVPDSRSRRLPAIPRHSLAGAVRQTSSLNFAIKLSSPVIWENSAITTLLGYFLLNIVIYIQINFEYRLQHYNRHCTSYFGI